MLKKLFLMFSLLTTVGANAVADVDQVSAVDGQEEQTSVPKISKPGFLKKAYNFCWGKRSGWTRAGITATFLPGIVLGAWLGLSCSIDREFLKNIGIIIFASLPGASHFLFGSMIWDKLKKIKCS